MISGVLSRLLSPLDRDIWRLAFPVMAERLAVSFLGMASLAMVGHIGKDATTVVSSINTITNVMSPVFNGFALGVTVLVARAVGANQLYARDECARNAVFAGAAAALLAFLLLRIGKVPLLKALYPSAADSLFSGMTEYYNIVSFGWPFLFFSSVVYGVLRGMGKMKLVLALSALMNGVHVAVGFCLVFGAGMGIQGAALGTLAGQIAAGILAALCMFQLDFKQFRPNWDILRRILRVGGPIMVEQFGINGGNVAMQSIVVGFGTVSAAAHSISMNIVSLGYMPISGMSTAATTLISAKLGGGDGKQARRTAGRAIFWSQIILCLFGAALLLLGNDIVKFYTPESDVRAVCWGLVCINAIIQPFVVLAMVTPAVLRGGGDNTYCMVTTFLGLWVVRILTGLLLAHMLGIGIYGVWIAISLDNVVRGIAYYLRYRRGKWVRFDL